ncbi:MAG: competence/damage-inducible protein A [Planctomycetota bacterium]|nr:competence/damage-inducible protein A [Planctomycetota bacterium]
MRTILGVRSVAILIIGDEILSGEIVDENGPWLIARLNEAGVRAVRQVVVPDDAEQIGAELTRLRGLADAVVVSGGIGPTHDDVTREAVAEALGLPLEEHAEAVERIRGYYGDRATDAELAMACLPRGSRLVNGAKTNTIGFAISGVYVFPGVPFLFRDLVAGVTPEFSSAPLHKQELRSDLREGEIAALLARFQGGVADVAIGSYPVCEEGCWHVRVVVRGVDPERVAAVAAEIGPRLG